MYLDIFHHCTHVNDNNESIVSHPRAPGGHVCSRDPSGSLPGLASIRQLPGASVGWPSPDRGHAGGASLRHGRERGPGNWHVCPQHGALQAPVQSHREVHTATQKHVQLVTSAQCGWKHRDNTNTQTQIGLGIDLQYLFGPDSWQTQVAASNVQWVVTGGCWWTCLAVRSQTTISDRWPTISPCFFQNHTGAFTHSCWSFQLYPSGLTSRSSLLCFHGAAVQTRHDSEHPLVHVDLKVEFRSSCLTLEAAADKTT